MALCALCRFGGPAPFAFCLIGGYPDTSFGNIQDPGSEFSIITTISKESEKRGVLDMVYLILVNLVQNKFDHPDDVSIKPADLTMDLTDMCLSKLENFRFIQHTVALTKFASSSLPAKVHPGKKRNQKKIY